MAALITAIVTGIVSVVGLVASWNKTTGNDLTNAERKQNEFNAEQAEINRDFNAEQAEIQRAWEQDMYMHRYQMQTQDMLSAGVNPAMMYGGSASPASTPSGAAASGSAASSGGFAPSQAPEMLNALTNALVGLSSARKNSAEAEGQEIRNLTEGEVRDWMVKNLQTDVEKKNADIQNALQMVRTGQADEALKRAGIDHVEAQASLVALQCIEQNITNENKQRLIDLQADLIAAQKGNLDIDAAKKAEEIQQIYAMTITEAFKQKALDSQAIQALASAGLMDAQTGLVNIDAKTRNLSNIVNIGVGITQALENTSDAVGNFLPSTSIIKKVAAKTLGKKGASFLSK